MDTIRSLNLHTIVILIVKLTKRRETDQKSMSFPLLIETSEATRKELDCKTKKTENPHNNYNVKHELSCAKYASFQESAESLLISMVIDLNQ